MYSKTSRWRHVAKDINHIIVDEYGDESDAVIIVSSIAGDVLSELP